jgi:signal transduction histidine kinase
LLYYTNMRVTESSLLADRIVATFRWLALVGLTLSLGWKENINQNFIYLIAISGLWNLGLTVLSLLRRRFPQHSYIATAADIIIGLSFFFLSDFSRDPFLWGALLPVLTGAFYFGVRGGLLLAAAMILSEGITLVVVMTDDRALSLIGVPLIVFLGVGFLLGFVAQQIGYRLSLSRDLEIFQKEEAQRIERERLKALYNITSAMTASLNYQRVLDMALDLTSSALAEPEHGTELVSAFCLYEGKSMCIGSARRFTPQDFRATLDGQEGIIATVLDLGEPRFTKNPAQDPEIRRVVALRNCGVVYCYPLKTSGELYGVLLFGHADSEYFDPSRREIMEFVGRQALVALQNARLYRDLEEEKERMAEIQEEARRTLARNLHDGPTQSVAAIAMRVNFARRLIERDIKAAGDELFKIEDLARRTTKEIRHMLFTLRPLVLETAGLIPAFESMAEKVRDTYGQNVLVEADQAAVESLEMGKQGVIFYIAEEAVNNARKHAEAEHIWVRLIAMKGEVVLLEIEDDGVGFDVGAVDSGYDQRGSLGMVNMRERTELVNGVFQLESIVGKGTRVRVWVPLSEDAADRLRHGR